MRTANLARILIGALALALAACDRPQQQPSTKAKAELPGGALETRAIADRGMVWLLNAGGLFLQDPRSGHQLAILLPDWQWASEPYACMPDLALGPRGELVVTSNVLPRLWRVDPGTLEVTVHALALDADHDRDVGFAGLVYSAVHPAYFAVSQLHGSLWMIDASLEHGRKIAPEDLADSSFEVESAFVRAACASTAPRS